MDLGQQIQAVQNRLNGLQQRVEDFIANSPLPIEVATEFSVTLQELHTITEALRQQNQTRLANRPSVGQELHHQNPRDHTADSQVVTAEQYRLALDLTQIGWWDWDIATDELTWSDRLFKLLGYQLGEVVPSVEAWRSRIHPDDWAWTSQRLQEVLASQTIGEVEYRVIHPDGSVHWLLVKGKGQYDAAGQPVRMVGIVMEVSQRKQLELSLQQSEERLRLALDLNQVGLWEWPMGTDILIWNDYNYYLLGYQPGEMEPRYHHWHDRIHPDDVSKVEQVLMDGLANQTACTVEYRLVSPDGGIRWLLGTGKGLYNQAGEPERMIGVVYDVSEYKRLELERQQISDNYAFLAEISQDLAEWTDIDVTMSVVAAKIGAFLRLSRCYTTKIDETAGTALTSYDWHLPGLDSFCSDQPYRMADFVTEAFYQAAHSGEMIVCRNTLNDPRINHEASAALGIRSFITAPYLQDGQLQFLFCATASAPRDWRQDEIDLMRELTTRIWLRLERAEAEEALRASEAKYRTLFNSIDEGYFLCDVIFNEANQPVDVAFLDVNPLATAIAGQDFTGRRLCDIDSNYGPDWYEVLGRVALSGSSERIEKYTEVNETWCNLYFFRVGNEDSRRVGLIIQNITERKLAEQKIQDQAALLDIAPDAIFAHDLSHHILYWNHGAERLYGYSSSAAIGQPVHDLVCKSYTHFSERIATLLTQGEWRGEVHHRHENGQELTLDARWILVRDDQGEPKYILSVETDITEKKQLEAQFYRAQRLDSLGILTGGIAHNLNNIFTPILDLSQLLSSSKSPLDARAKEMVEILYSSAQRGASMVKQILTFTRGTSEVRSPVDMVALLTEIARIMEQVLPKSILIQEDIPEQASWYVLADSTYLHQIVMNLLINARDAMPNGGILTISVELCSIDEKQARTILEAQVGDYVVVTVADTGTGISPEIRDHIFDPFFTTKEPDQGTGLGLPTVLGIVKDYGGFLQVFSDVGQGTQMKVYLPQLEGGASLTMGEAELLEGEWQAILLVDDEVDVQRSTQTLLEEHRYFVLATNDSREALDLYLQHQNEIAAIIMDLTMPHIGGLTLTQQLKEINPKVKIMAMSGLPTNQEAALAAGATVFLPKPYGLETLLRELRQLVL